MAYHSPSGMRFGSHHLSGQNEAMHFYSPWIGSTSRRCGQQASWPLTLSRAVSSVKKMRPQGVAAGAWPAKTVLMPNLAEWEHLTFALATGRIFQLGESFTKPVKELCCVWFDHFERKQKGY
jgi:hypothetical protein